MTNPLFNRQELLLGSEAMERIARAKVIILGTGGVGGWCAESLVRSGISHLTIVDSDRICITNCNRQVMATSQTVGEVKVEALRRRLLEINPKADIRALQKIYGADTKEEFHLEGYDYVIDAIDSLKDKIQLILHATSLDGVTLFSSMGAALRTDPFSVRCAEFWKVHGDTLAAMMRKRMRQRKLMPSKKFLCVYSDELPQPNRGAVRSCGTSQCICPKAKLLSGERGTATAVYDAPGDQTLVEHEWCTAKAQINGTACHVTAMFGFALAGLVINDITAKK